ncbi:MULTISPECIES: hypothetical protein [unclassified Oleiphilus]|nr:MULTISPECIES: hypothetical protein [unclassified Oleiphilus]KZY73741.1 hypothetical protein A3740_18295 [Oleiphilus sp. HI0068]KZY81082.1 hypothetical protein A3741_17860 [Oleiphilus sp. HI0069]KZZ12694.1 hypothetical protein A3749_27075 [Oleiphilus sp. HI0078]KZY62131.1 hypothetical protein A3735_27410 [Oleiphilus sp. HI0061]KZZ34188.1 hypothetical protein A3756_18190 [Oleiphilus sp. HI0086]
MKHIFVIAVLALLSGCSSMVKTEIGDYDYGKSLSELQSQHIELQPQDGLFSEPRISIPLDDAKSLWGEPQSTENLWGEKALGSGIALSAAATGLISWAGYGVIELMFLPPCQEHVWSIKNKQVLAKSCSTIGTGYQSKIVKWDWSEN